MPWQNQGGGGGPWGGGGGGGSGGGGGPWGNNPWGRGSGGGGQQPNIEELIKQAQERLKRFLPKGPGGASPNLLFYGLVAIVLIWVLSGIYRVQPGEQGVVVRFGEFVATTDSGLHYHLPSPIEHVIKVDVGRENTLNLGARAAAQRRAPGRDASGESSMLTGDQNIVEIDMNVQWKVKDAQAFLFNIRDPEQTLRAVTESAIREIIGRTEIQPALTDARGSIEEETKLLMQQIMDEYKAGVLVGRVQLQQVQPPQQVIDAFNDVQRALQDRDRAQNEAEAYRNDIIPRARGEAVKLVQDAAAYKEKVVNESTGNAQRFLSVYNEYKNARDVTTKRIYFETMEQILRGAKKIVAGDKAGLAPYLPLPVPPTSAPAPKTGGSP